MAMKLKQGVTYDKSTGKVTIAPGANVDSTTKTAVAKSPYGSGDYSYFSSPSGSSASNPNLKKGIANTGTPIPLQGQTSSETGTGMSTDYYQSDSFWGVKPTVPTGNGVNQGNQGNQGDGSVSSILGDNNEDPIYKQMMLDAQNAYNTPIDENKIRQDKLGEYQAQIDATNSVYADKLAQSRIQGEGRLGSGRAMQARGGLLGSDFGAAQTDTIQGNNNDIYNSIEQERLAVVNQILTQAKESGAAEIAAKRAAKEAGGKAYLEFLSAADTRKNEKLSKAAKTLLVMGKTPDDLSDEELKAAGINRADLVALYTEGKAGMDASASEAERKKYMEDTKFGLESEKTQSEIDKLNREAIKNYEVGGIIYNADGEQIGIKEGKNYEAGGDVYEAGTNKWLRVATKSGDRSITGTTGTSGTGATGDLRGFASQFPNEASLKNNNPAGITFNQSFADRLTSAGIQFEKGTNRPAAEGGSYFSFPNIEEGFKAYDLLWSSPSYTSLTLNQALNRWNTGSTEKGYGIQISGEVGVNGNIKVSDLTSDQLRKIQMAQLKRESPGMYKVMSEGQATGNTYKYIPGQDSNVDSWATNIMSGKAKMSDITGVKNTDLKNKVAVAINALNDGKLAPVQNNLKESVALVQQLIDHPGRSSATGVPNLLTNPFGNALPGTNAREFKALVERLNSLLFLNAIPQMRGMGQLTEREGAKLEASSSITKDLGISETAYLAELNRLKKQLEESYGNVGGSDTDTPPPGNGPVAPTNTGNGNGII